MNHDFQLPDGSYSVLDIQNYIKYIIKKHEILTTVIPIHVYINRINKRLVFKILILSRIAKFSNNEIIWQHKKKSIDKTKSGDNVPSLKVDEVVLAQCNLVDNQHQV